jgi:hypothetical protein
MQVFKRLDIRPGLEVTDTDFFGLVLTRLR